MSAPSPIDRRTFIRIFGGGVVVFVSLGPEVLAQERRRGAAADWNAYLRIGENGRVTLFSGKIEMGQGVMTSQAQLVAEELGVPLDAIDVVLGDTDLCPWDRGTFGSQTTRTFGPVLRAAAAEARGVLTQLAAERLGVPSQRLVVADGIVSVAGDPRRKVTYGQLARGQAIARTLDERAVLRSASEFKVIGRPAKRIDGRDKVTGAAKYAADIRRPGMLYARLLRPPAHGAKLLKADTSRAAKLEGVKVVNQEGLVAVLHADPEAAAQALEHVEAEWSTPEPGADHDGIFEELLKRAPAPEIKYPKGDIATAAGVKRFQQTYHKGYVAHAPIEPHAALAEITEGKATVWASTQTPFPTRDDLAEVLGMDPKAVRVITPYVGGGFGGKSGGQQAEEAARLAKITGKPVQVAWTRAEEFFYDTFDPAAIVEIKSAIDAQGRITLWDYDVYFAGDRGMELCYDVPNVRMRAFGGWWGEGPSPHRFGIGPWRAPGANMNVFARESHIDTMAAAAGIDPLDFRLRNMSDERMRRVLKAAADRFGWTPAPGPSGRGRGIACGVDAGAYVALCAELKLDAKQGTIKVERVACAQDMGIVVNPEGARMQVEGCITMGLGYVLSEELHFKGGQMLDQNFDTYVLPRLSWLPRIEIVFVENASLPPQGGGEPAIVPMGAVVANAVFDAARVRLSRLPMTPERVRAELAKESGRPTA